MIMPAAAAPAEPVLAVEGLTNPGDFEDLEDNHSFRVQELDGLFLMLISMIGGQEREPAMFQMQYTINASSADAVFVLNDARAPVSRDAAGLGYTSGLASRFRDADSRRAG